MHVKPVASSRQWTKGLVCALLYGWHIATPFRAQGCARFCHIDVRRRSDSMRHTRNTQRTEPYELVNINTWLLYEAGLVSSRESIRWIHSSMVRAYES